MQQLPPEIIIQRDHAPGLLWSGKMAHLAYKCTELEYLWYWNHATMAGNFIPSNLRGIAYKVKIQERPGGKAASPVEGYVNLYGGSWGGTKGDQSLDVFLEIYKTEPSVVRGVLSGYIFTVGYTPVNLFYDDIHRINLPTQIKIVSLGCSIYTPELTFNFGDIMATEFHGVGNKVGEQSKNVRMNCDIDAKVNVRLIGIKNPDLNDNSVLALDSQGYSNVATGVGVQFSWNNIPLVLGQTTSVKISSGGNELIPITARYYQTQSVVKPGRANAIASLEFTYL
ncbi:fimbrial protein [Aeromonas bestiarum]|uniref:fimbrial protein n=1 Tax=Aeromonas bestiarum TaxID=105751 RepID=UPI003D1CB370